MSKLLENCLTARNACRALALAVGLLGSTASAAETLLTGNQEHLLEPEPARTALRLPYGSLGYLPFETFLFLEPEAEGPGRRARAGLIMGPLPRPATGYIGQTGWYRATNPVGPGLWPYLILDR